jgi:hypothetical protein
MSSESTASTRSRVRSSPPRAHDISMNCGSISRHDHLTIDSSPNTGYEV